MSRIITALLTAIVVLSMLETAHADALEFFRSDLYPQFTTIAFSRTTVYFSGKMLRGKVPLWYALDRHDNTFERLKTPPEKTTVPGLVVPPKAMRVSEYAAGDVHAEVTTSKNVSFDSHIPYCGEGYEGDGELDFDGKKIPVPLHHCDGPGAIETYGKYLLIGSRYSGEGGESADKPVIVLDAKTHRLIKRIQFAASVIRVDPFDNQVWMAGVHGIAVLDKDLNIRKRWYYYIGFQPVDHKPALLLSEKPVKDKPLADLERVIGVKNIEGWYKAVQTIPVAQRKKFSLYDLHMSGFQRLPKDFNVLMPFIMKVIQSQVSDQKKYFAIKTLCGISDPGVVPFLHKLNLDSKLDKSLHESVNKCLRSRNQ